MVHGEDGSGDSAPPIVGTFIFMVIPRCRPGAGCDRVCVHFPVRVSLVLVVISNGSFELSGLILNSIFKFLA